MRLASQSVFFWTLVALLALAGACATTISPERRQRMSDCAAQCDTGREPPQIGPMGMPANQHDTRSDCEKRCQ
ncbi:MAG TPA: hypothetical protein VJ801_00055 [Polyangia bacterium]|jgi:hypothetical protein|nr:hypothetical protein [Polyangia bacterium]